MELKGRSISKGVAEGEALVTRQPLSFYGGVDPDTGMVSEKGHELEGKCITGKILVFPNAKGSTVGSYTLYRMKKQGTAPAAMVNESAETIIAVGAIISGIPLVDSLDGDIFELLKNGSRVRVDGAAGKLKIL